MGFRIQVDSDYFTHPKVVHLQAILGDPSADVYPIRLWAWASKYATKGILQNAAVVEIACGWKGEKGSLLSAMQQVGLVEADGVTIHDWMQNTGHFLALYEAKLYNQREEYRNKSEERRKKVGRKEEESRNSGILSSGKKEVKKEVKKERERVASSDAGVVQERPSASLSRIPGNGTKKEDTPVDRLADYCKSIEIGNPDHPLKVRDHVIALLAKYKQNEETVRLKISRYLKGLPCDKWHDRLEQVKRDRPDYDIQT